MPIKDNKQVWIQNHLISNSPCGRPVTMQKNPKILLPELAFTLLNPNIS